MTSTRTFRLPDVGEGLTEAEVVRWLVAEGDVVAVNAPVVEVETAKSIVELPSPWAGRVERLLVAEGVTVDVGTELIAVGVDDPAAASAPEPAGKGEVDGTARAHGADGAVGTVGTAAADEGDGTDGAGGAGVADGQAGRGLDDEGLDAQGSGSDLSVVDADAAPSEPDGAPSDAPDAGRAPGAATDAPDPGATSVLVGYGVRESATTGRRRRRRSAQRVAPTGTPVPAAAPAAEPPAPRPLATPPVRLLARSRGVDLASVTGSGAGGVITRADVLGVAEAPGASPDATSPEPSRAAASLSPEADDARERRIPVRGVRKAIAQAMVTSAFTAPHTSAHLTVDVTRTVKLLARLRADRSFEGVHVSPLLVVARAMCLAVGRHPGINSSWDEAAQEIVVKDYVNLGVAVASERGLLVPNVKDAQALDLTGLAQALTALVRTARDGRTSPADMARGTISVTNVGVFGVDGGTPILNPGESAILCMGAVTRRPWVHKGKVRPRSVVELSLSFDHRVVDGDLGSRFLADVGALLERPDRALLWA